MSELPPPTPPQPLPQPYATPGVPMIAPEPRETFVPKKVAAGICGILLGSFGVHKFILGLTTPGIIMLCVSVLTCGFGAIVMSVIGIVEGIMYLSKNDEQFYQDYAVQKRGWF